MAFDPYGRYLLTPNFDSNSVSLISDFQVGPVIRSITPDKGSSKGGTEFTIDGFVDPLIFTNNVKVCFRNKRFCATSVTISDDGKKITGVTPKFPRASIVDLILITEKKPNISTSSNFSSGSIQCTKEISTQTIYKQAFRF